ncbi:hypothetical protein ACF2JD_10060 [Aeromonas sp. A-5]|uniref:hypothetical protein n=1 Tax=Aeromonas ichthyocola TaxID=3367746 RepID=UPI0038E5920C
MMSPDIVMAISLLTLFVVTGIALGFWSLIAQHLLPRGDHLYSRLCGLIVLCRWRCRR